jgi:hypothetical protein
MATLADVCPHHETWERGVAAKVQGRTGSEGVRGMFREQSWKGCLRASLCRCRPNFRGSGVYVPRSVDWNPALWCIISLLTRTNEGNQVAPLTREHPRRRYTPVDYPWTQHADEPRSDAHSATSPLLPQFTHFFLAPSLFRTGDTGRLSLFPRPRSRSLVIPSASTSTLRRATRRTAD